MNYCFKNKYTSWKKLVAMLTVFSFIIVFVGADFAFSCPPPPPPPPPPNHNCPGDPVNGVSGSYETNVTDINIPGKGFPLVFQRIYKSRYMEDSFLGNWDHNLNVSAKLNVGAVGMPIDMVRYPNGYSYEVFPRILVSFEIKTPEGVNVVFNAEKAYTWVPDKDVPSVSEIMNLLTNGEEIEHPEGEYSFWGVPERMKSDDTTLKSVGAEHSKVTKNADDTITWRKKDGTEYNFSVFKGTMTRIPAADGAAWRQQPTAKLLSLEDRNGNEMTFAYNNTDYNLSTNKLTSVTDPSSRQLTFTDYGTYTEVKDNDNRVWKYYVTDGELVKVVDPLDHYVEYEYTDGDLTKYTNKRGYEWNLVYDSDHRQTAVIDPYDNIFTNVYSTHTVTSPFVEVSTYAYAKEYRKLTVIWPNNDEEVFISDPVRGGAVMKIDPSGLENIYQYDTDGNIIKVIAKKNGSILRTTNFFYDNYGNVTRAILPGGNEHKWTYNNTYNVPTAYYDPLGSTTTYTYDSNGNLTEITDPENNTSTFTYNSNGQVTYITDSRGNTTGFTYNSYGYVTKITDSLGKETDFSYDDVGNVTSVTDALDYTTDYTYDDMDRLIKITDHENNETDMEYDANGNLTKITDANDNETNYTYDKLNRVITVTDALSNTTTYEYDSVNNLTKVTNAEGYETNYEYEKAVNITIALNKLSHSYNAQYLLTKKIDSLSNEKTFSYNDLGLLSSVTDYNGNTVNYTYNTNDWLTQKSYPDFSTIDFTYDNNGRISVVSDDNGTITYTYDKSDRVTQIDYPNSNTVGYSYDSAGNKTQIVYTDTSTVNYSYDVLNRISTVEDFSGNISTYTYNDVGRLSDIEYANGVSADFSYDTLNRLTSLEYTASTTTIYRSTYTYDNTGNRLSKTFANGDYWSYQYDDLYRLTSAVKKTSAESVLVNHPYSYDDVGNRTSDSSDNYTNNADNRLTSIDNGTTFSYDNNGNMTTKTIGAQSTSFEYDYRNQMVQITYPGVSVNTFKYDPFGRRIEKVDSSGTKKYVWDGINVISEYGASNNLTDKYSYGTGIMVLTRKVESSGDIYYYHQDELGSIVKITDSNGNVVNNYDYDDFGNILSQTEGIPNSYKYTGKELDSDSGLYYYGARYYALIYARFLQRDPIGYLGGINHYIYVENNPINWVDLWGLYKSEVDVLPDSEPVVELGNLEFWDIVYKSHRKGKRRSTRERHQGGEARKKRDKCGEKGDVNRRPHRKRPPGHKGPWPPKLMPYVPVIVPFGIIRY